MSNYNSLKSFVKKLFQELAHEEYSFSYVDPEDSIISNSILFKDAFKNNYYLLFFVNNVSDLKYILDRQSQYFFLLKEFYNEFLEVDKNTSMVIFHRTNDLNFDALLLEEDPYYFKKYVLPYTEEQFDGFIEAYSNALGSSEIKSVLNEVISDVSLFEEFKAEPDNLNVYQFVSNLFIKIPSLKVPVDVNKNIYLLKDSLNNSLKEKGLLDLKHLIDSQIFSEETLQDEDELNSNVIDSLIKVYKGREE